MNGFSSTSKIAKLLKTKKNNNGDNFIPTQKDYSHKVLELVGHLAAGADHEINNLSMIIEGSIEILQDESISNERKLMALSNLATKTHRIQEIMADLRSILKDGTNEQIKRLKMKDIIQKSIHLCRTRFKNHKIFFKIEISENLQVEGKETQLTQAFLFILASCHDALVNHNQRWLNISVYENDSSVFFKIEDSGDELSQNDKKNIFSPFYTTSDGRGGVGLTIAKNIIEDHHGKITLHNDTEKHHPQMLIEIPKIKSAPNVNSLKVVEEIEIYGNRQKTISSNIPEEKKAA